MNGIGDGPTPMQLERFGVVDGIEDSENYDLEEANTANVGSQQQKSSLLHPIRVFIASQFERQQVAVSSEHPAVGSSNVAGIRASTIADVPVHVGRGILIFVHSVLS
jgi:hypothetical protein